MTYRVVQRGASPVIVCYLVGSHMDPELRNACPGRAIVATDKSGLNANGIDLAAAKKLAGHTADAPVILVGYSAGCQGVRSHLLLGESPTHVLCIDGTHASIPPAQWQIDVWRKLAEQARAGKVVFVGTCTQMTYVERIPAGQPGRALSTRHVLEQACGVAALEPGTEIHDGGLHLHSYPSADIDKEAHILQQREVLPGMLRRYVGGALVVEEPAGPSLAKRVSSAILGGLTWLVGGLRPTAVLAKPRLGEALLEEARKDLHVREVGGMNRGPEVDAYNVALGVPLGSSWCASSLTTWLRRACVRLGVPMPIAGSAGAKTVMSQLQKAGRWHDVAELRRNPKLLRPGMILVWDRGGWKGHVGVFAAMRGERGLATVEGNSGSGPFGEGNRVADDMPRTLDDPRLLGAGWVD